MTPTFLSDFFYEFVTLFVILDPIATLPIFLMVTAGLDRRRSLQVAAYALGVAFLILLFFIVVGRPLLSALHIPMASYQLAGSLVLLLFGLKMVLGNVTEDAPSMPEDATPLQRAVFPLAVPGIAGAGAILTVHPVEHCGHGADRRHQAELRSCLRLTISGSRPRHCPCP